MIQHGQDRGIDSTIHQVFREVAASHRHRTALACGERRISYGELAAWADQIADTLRLRGVGLGSLVGLYMQRSPESIAAILGILKAGAAYVPFDPSYPLNLLRHMCEDSAPVLMLVDRSGIATALAARFWDCPMLDPSADLGQEDILEPAFDRPPALSSDLAYVMYTSGSTGTPKGVLIPHRAVLRLVLGNNFAHLDANEVLLQLAPLTFDASTFEIWGALLNGGTLAILPLALPSLKEIAEAIERHGVTTLWLTAGLFHLMVEHCIDGLKPLRQLLAGGDVLSPSHVRKLLLALPQCRLINGYGPTENTTFTCCYTIPAHPLPEGPIPIGKAILHTDILILDEAQRPVEEGHAGELYAGGAGLANGYLNQAQLTAEKFLTLAFAASPDIRLYRTGDQVRRRPDGNLDFLGRADRQIKINGKRVELDALEACLRRNPLVSDAAAVSFVGTDEQRRIASFVTLACPAPDAEAELRRFLGRELPDYMVPSLLEVVDALPLGPNGKVNRARLPTPPPAGRIAAATPMMPSGDMEAVLVQLWQQVLGIDTADVDSNFFDLGGTSLQLIKLHAQLQSTLGRVIPLLDLFEYPSIAALAARLAQASLPQRGSTLTAADHRARLRNAQLGPRQGLPS
jgi:amino acid adenylation domain-containing protein